MEKKEFYEVRVSPDPSGERLKVEIGGELDLTDSFEFVAPLGVGLTVKKVTRVELVPAIPNRREY